jgi:hypothetical protein
MLIFASNLKLITRKNGHFPCLPLGNKVFLFLIFDFYADDYDSLGGIIICIIQALLLSAKHCVSRFIIYATIVYWYQKHRNITICNYPRFDLL